MVRTRAWGLRRPCRLQAHNPATGARRGPRSCTGDTPDVSRNRWSLPDPPPPRISGPSRGVRERGRK